MLHLDIQRLPIGENHSGQLVPGMGWMGIVFYIHNLGSFSIHQDLAKTLERFVNFAKVAKR
jgi:hypothetical protein